VTEFARSTGLAGVEARRSCQSNSCYRHHTHAEFSVGRIESGASVLSGSVGQSTRLREGDVVVVPPEHVHACNPEGRLWRYRMVHLPRGVVRRWAPGLVDIRGIGIYRDSLVRREADALVDGVFADLPVPELGAEIRRAAFALSAVAPLVRLPLQTSDPAPVVLTPVLWTLANAPEIPSLTELAASLHMTPAQFARAVRRSTGMAPMAWRQDQRIRQARTMLRKGASIAQTAAELGFSDQSHFHRVFRKHVAATPGGYRG